MKRSVFLLFINFFFLLEINLTFGQKISGVFIDSSDYTNQILLFKEYKIKNCTVRKLIKIHNCDTTILLQKDSIFGFQTKEGNVFRFYKGQDCLLLNSNEEIKIYQYVIRYQNSKNPYQEVSYYYSTKSDNNLKDLTIKNILKDYSENKNFQLLIEIYFKHDYELIQFDSINHQFKINRLLTLSRQNSNFLNLSR